LPDTYIPPDDIPRSPSGRIPQWVLDQALGKPVGPVPFRPPTDVAPPRRRSRTPRILVVLCVLVPILLLVGVAARDHRWPFGNPAASAEPVGAVPGVARQAPPPGLEESTAPLGAPPDVAAGPEGDGYRFSQHQDATGGPVTWSPCRPIHYVVRTAHQPEGGKALLRDAVAQVSAATGLRFVDDGTTDEGPSEDRGAYQPERYGDRWAPVLIAWATADEVPDFGVDVAGEAGPIWVTPASGASVYVSGVVYLDPAKLAGAPPAAAKAVVLHELGHLVGLAHVNDAGAVMFPRASGVTAYASGDLAGLAALGRGACRPDV
jgi:hypothetical protein